MAKTRASRQSKQAKACDVTSCPEMPKSEVLLARVDDKYEKLPEVRANMSLEATTTQIKTLFRLKDEVEALCDPEDRLSFAQVVLLASDFYLKECKVDEGWQTLLPAEDLPADAVERMQDIRPVRINMFLSSGTLGEFKNNLKAIFSKLKPFKEVNVYWVLNEVFRFALKRSQSFSKLANPKEKPLNGPTIKCEVCKDHCKAVEYCSVFVCGKCRRFFQSLMLEKTLFSLRCGRNNDCKKDIVSCRKCRADRCKSLGMHHQYYLTEMQVFFFNTFYKFYLFLSKYLTINQFSCQGYEYINCRPVIQLSE